MATIYILGYQSFSRYFMSQSSVSLIFPSNTSRSSLCIYFTFSYCVGSTLSCLAARAQLYIFSLPVRLPPPPPPGYWYTSIFFLASSAPLHEIAVSFFFLRSRANTLPFLSLRLTPRLSLECFSDFILFLSLVVPFFLCFLLLLSCTSQSSPWTASPLGFLLRISFSNFRDYAIPPCSSSPFCCFLPYSSINHGWQPRFRHVPYFILPFQLSHIPVCIKWVYSPFCS